MGLEGHTRLIVVFHDIPVDRRILEFGAHSVMRVAMMIPGLNGVRVLVTHGGTSKSSADGVGRCEWATEGGPHRAT